MRKQIRLFLAGGTYRVGLTKYNACVSPSGKNQLYYVWTEPIPWRSHCEHHAHLYEVIDNELHLIKESFEASPAVGAPKKLTLDADRNILLLRTLEAVRSNPNLILNYRGDSNGEDQVRDEQTVSEDSSQKMEGN